MDFFNKIPVMDRTALRELKKGIDSSFKEFSRAYGDGIEGFFDPLLHFLIWLEKLLVNSPWTCLLYTSPSPRDLSTSRMPSSA